MMHQKLTGACGRQTLYRGVNVWEQILVHGARNVLQQKLRQRRKMLML